MLDRLRIIRATLNILMLDQLSMRVLPHELLHLVRVLKLYNPHFLRAVNVQLVVVLRVSLIDQHHVEAALASEHSKFQTTRLIVK